MLPPLDMEEGTPSSGRLAGVYKFYRPLVDFLEQEGAMALCMMIALHIISTGLVMFLGGFILTAIPWVLNFVPKHAYASVSIQLGTITAYIVILVLPLPLFKTLRRRYPGCLSAIASMLAWEVLVVRWFCVEDDRNSRLSLFLRFSLVRNAAFVLALALILYGGVLAWTSARGAAGAGRWSQRLFVVLVLAEVFALQEFYRNGV